MWSEDLNRQAGDFEDRYSIGKKTEMFRFQAHEYP
jgi:hypothetical protein